MAYKETDWTSILTPFLRGIEGDTPLTSSFDDLDWREDEQQLDPFTTEFDAQVQRFTGTADSQARQTLKDSISLPTAVKARESFKLPTASTRGDGKADLIAASKGVDPGKPGGSGNLLDIAKTMIGVPYVFGSGAGTDAFDCSEFAQWVYSRGMGVSLPRTAAEQAASIGQHVKRDELQPGDLVFYSYGRLGPGGIDHVAIYMGGGKQIAASSSADQVTIQTVDWGNFEYGGRRPGAEPAATGKGFTAPVKKGAGVKQAPVANNQTLAPMALSDGPPAFGMVMDSILTPDTVAPLKRDKGFRGASGSTDKQLYQGFIDAGRPDLARMVGTKDFRTWLNQESGYDPSTVSQPYDGIRNYGIFQFRGHDWQQQYINANGEWTADAYTQAKLVAKYFGHLTPGKIHEYAAQIKAGDYHGWG